MVDKLKNFLAEEVPKVFSDSDYENHEDCGNYVGFLQEVCWLLYYSNYGNILYVTYYYDIQVPY